MVVDAKGGHLGGSFSVIDLLVALYAGKILSFNSSLPDMPFRDRFILSKGHSCMALYCVLAREKFFPMDVLSSYCKDGSILAGHPEHCLVPGVEVSSGSLGHCLSVSVGLALGAKRNKEVWRTVCILGDGECNEGSVWEALMAASQFKLENLIAVIDSNKFESLDTVDNILSIEPLAERLRSFGWQVIEIDGHDYSQIFSAFHMAGKVAGMPFAIIAHTIKGKGVSFMEGVPKWHHRKLTDDEYRIAKNEIQMRLDCA